MSTWIDVTVPIRPGMVHWPDNPGVEREVTKEPVDGGLCFVSKLTMGVHTGTHFDAPIHFDVPGGGVEALPPAALIGVARVVAVEGRTIDRADVEALNLEEGERVLFKTSNSARCWNTDEFVPDYVYVTVDAAQHLADRRIALLGVDYLSMGGPDHGPRAHRILLRAGVCILEGLDLRQVGPGTFEMVALPLLIPGSDGAPARVLLRSP
ncbi:Metal-dependent hydrolase [Labilithrix luteola]|uniref:Kynurenine formamidase n=1 Tax=Labilithrix luteola TaxID=1391654 RepID=A0A0K1Q394_9BACT|nr:cyclase family protein [Labilithrix luteola]AKV00234.1 Metal-dependent hydrolase [Labilithrix luteola]